ncbi:hypothetical protein GCM10009104_34870 [Marinobacterium maritimum]|uniref:Toxin CptA n=1 Tax=Marinobacterium maritimum TaxID=500162 RepID=A0ABN1IAS3_9GAMM
MNAFSPIKIHLRRGRRLLRILYPATLFLGGAALFHLSAEPERLVLVLVAYLLVGSVIVWQLMVMDAADEVCGLDWDVEHKMMSVLTLEGNWVPVDKLYRRLSVQGVVHLLLLQRRDRALPSWLWITPDRLSADEARRLHVALTLGPPIAPNPATEN